MAKVPQKGQRRDEHHGHTLMSDHALHLVSRRILNRPQLISERGALAVLGALAPRLGLGRTCDAGAEALVRANWVAASD